MKKVYSRIAHRAISMWGTTDTWRIDGSAYICSSGLNDHFNIPKDANELEVEIIVSKRRPDPEAHRVWSIRGETLEIEGFRGERHESCHYHSTHPRFRNQLRTAQNYAKKHDSKVWMLCRYATVSFQIAEEGGRRRGFGG